MAYRIASNAHHPIVCNYLIMQRRYNGSRSMRVLTDLHLPFMSSLDKSCNVHHMEEGGDLASRLPVVAQPVISAVWHCHATCRGEGKEERRRKWKKRRRRRRRRGWGRGGEGGGEKGGRGEGGDEGGREEKKMRREMRRLQN